MLLEDGEPTLEAEFIGIQNLLVGSSMVKPPVLKPRQVAAILEALGFVEVRQRGSHKQYRHPDGRGTTVPFHAGRDVSPLLLRQIAKDIGLTLEDFLAAR